MKRRDLNRQGCSFTWLRAGGLQWSCSKSKGHHGRHRLKKVAVETTRLVVAPQPAVVEPQAALLSA